MDIQISDKNDGQYSSSVNLTIGKKSARVSLCKIFPGRVNVLCKNAMHAAWGGPGRFFGSWELALDGYKSGAMKAAIETAREELDPAPVVEVETEDVADETPNPHDVGNMVGFYRGTTTAKDAKALRQLIEYPGSEEFGTGPSSPVTRAACQILLEELEGDPVEDVKDPRDTDFDQENAGMEAALAGEARDETQGRDWLSGWDLGREVETDPREYAPENDPRGPIWAANGEWPTDPAAPSLQDAGDAVAEPVHLIGHGLHPAVFVSQLLPGDVLAFNGPTFATVVDVSPVPSKSGAFATLTTTSKGVVYQSRKRLNCAVAFVEHGAAPVLSGALPEDHPRAWRKLSIRTLEEAPYQSFPLKHPTTEQVVNGIAPGDDDHHPTPNSHDVVVEVKTMHRSMPNRESNRIVTVPGKFVNVIATLWDDDSVRNALREARSEAAELESAGYRVSVTWRRVSDAAGHIKQDLGPGVPTPPSPTPWTHDQVGARQPLRPLKADPQAKIADESEAYTRGRLPEGLTIREIPAETFKPDSWSTTYDTEGHGGRRDFYRTVDDLLHGEKGLAETLTVAQLDRYVAAYLDWMTRRNSVPNWAIAGPAKFNHRKRDKMSNAADNAFKRFEDVQTSIRRQCARAAREAHVADAGGPIELLRTEIAELEKLSALMKGANKIVRRKPKNVSTEAKLEELVALGMKSTVAAKLFVEDFARRFGFPGYQLSGARADIKRKKDRITELEQREEASSREDVEHRFDEIQATVTLCYSQDRIKIRHDTKVLGLAAKPELRRHGFLWSPASGAWQRMLSTDGAWHAGLALGVTVPG